MGPPQLFTQAEVQKHNIHIIVWGWCPTAASHAIMIACVWPAWVFLTYNRLIHNTLFAFFTAVQVGTGFCGSKLYCDWLLFLFFEFSFLCILHLHLILHFYSFCIKSGIDYCILYSKSNGSIEKGTRHAILVSTVISHLYARKWTTDWATRILPFTQWEWTGMPETF